MNNRPKLSTAVILMMVGIALPTLLLRAEFIPADYRPIFRGLLLVVVLGMLIAAVSQWFVWWNFHATMNARENRRMDLEKLRLGVQLTDNLRNIPPSVARMVETNGITAIWNLSEGQFYSTKLVVPGGDIEPYFVAKCMYYSTREQFVERDRFTTEIERLNHTRFVSQLVYGELVDEPRGPYPARWKPGGYDEVCRWLAMVIPHYNVQTWKPD